MTVFRWIIGVLSLLFAGSWALTVMLYVLRGDDNFRDLGTQLRRWLFTLLLFWFNIEIWGRVILTIVRWK